MKITFYGHACFGIEIDGVSIIIDPFIRPNELAKDIDIDAIKADYVLLTHGHEDHVADAMYLAQKNNSTIVSNFEIVSWFAKNGHEKGHPMNHGGNKDFGKFAVKYVNAVHSSVLPDGTYGGNPGGFILKTNNTSVYFAGDTALSMDMKLLGEFEKLDAAVLPIGDNFTMGIEDACIASDFIQCNKIIGMHFDTFPYIVIDKKYALDYFNERNKELILLEIGEKLNI
jgi:L-ascorbate metabolism protein UlaG (beta-lactamase superfamily)